MRNLILIAVIWSFQISFSFAQLQSWQDTTTLFVKERGYLKDPVRSKWNSHIKKDGSNWVISLYDRKNVIQEQIQYADEELSVRQGPYNAYWNGVLKIKGQYNKGYKHGLWEYYGKETLLIEEANFYYDQYHGQRILYYYKGQRKRVENYVKGALHGVSSVYYPNGSIAAQEEYENGVLQSGAKYYDIQGSPIEKSQLPIKLN
ncbi:MAG: hypothetical protein EOO99_07900 [Pedobacter sp.]|nr:MAG: hypothetical protein EOO99_07900 [Pedobacter sp.]